MSSRCILSLIHVEADRDPRHLARQQQKAPFGCAGGDRCPSLATLIARGFSSGSPALDGRVWEVG